jgi:hypothetical protein
MLEHAGKAIIDEKEEQMIIAMKKVQWLDPFASKLIKGLTNKEVAVFGTKDGVRLKGLIDGYSNDAL